MLNLVNLDDRTRALMLEELEADASESKVHLSSWLSNRGQQDYVGLLREAASSHDAAWLAVELAKNRRLKQKMKVRLAPLKSTTRDLPVNAAEVLAEVEFNKLYGRGVCRCAIAAGIENVIVYRAKEVHQPRPDSSRLIGMAINAQQLLDDIRSHPGEDTELGLFRSGSGLSVRLP
jgi:hypothetical protein